jgi:hypothetical protein
MYGVFQAFYRSSFLHHLFYYLLRLFRHTSPSYSSCAWWLWRGVAVGGSDAFHVLVSSSELEIPHFLFACVLGFTVLCGMGGGLRAWWRWDEYMFNDDGESWTVGREFNTKSIWDCIYVCEAYSLANEATWTGFLRVNSAFRTIWSNFCSASRHSSRYSIAIACTMTFQLARLAFCLDFLFTYISLNFCSDLERKWDYYTL